jgi:hypothetical protein
MHPTHPRIPPTVKSLIPIPQRISKIFSRIPARGGEFSTKLLCQCTKVSCQCTKVSCRCTKVSWTSVEILRRRLCFSYDEIHLFETGLQDNRIVRIFCRKRMIKKRRPVVDGMRGLFKRFGCDRVASLTGCGIF